jgi:DNA-binding NarL/FixJ family response regulator
MRRLPDVALVDLELPPASGIEAIANVLACSPQTRVLVFTAYKNDERVIGAIEAGAHGYLLKGTPRQQIFDAIRSVASGETVFDSAVAQILGRRSQASKPELLTPRQAEIVALLAEGQSNREMAARLHISERTVKYHLGALFNRLGAGNRTEALAAAMRAGLVKQA